MSECISTNLLVDEVIRKLGGPELADEYLYATAYRRMQAEGEFVWEMFPSSRKRTASKFLKLWDEASEEDREHLNSLIRGVAEAFNEVGGGLLNQRRKPGRIKHDPA